MDNLKLTKQFKEVISHSAKNINSCISLQIKSESASLSGLSRKLLTPSSAIVLIQRNKQIYVKGHFEDVNFEFSSIENLDASDSILLGVDCSNKDNNIIYYRSGNSIVKLSPSSAMNPYDFVYIFWDIGPCACLTICAYDPSQDEIIREVDVANNEPLKRFLRSVVRQTLPSHEENTERNDNSFDIEEDSEDWGTRL